MLPARDRELVQIVDSALAEAHARARRDDGTSWLACRPGCTPCCHGVFKISLLDAERLYTALVRMDSEEPSRAACIRARAQEAVRVLSASFPGNVATGLLSSSEDAWDTFADLPATDIACPVLDPITGRCELYEGRPLTCRIFGPPVLGEHGVGVCELCYVGADEGAILAGQMSLTHAPLEQELEHELPAGETVIAWVLAKQLAL